MLKPVITRAGVCKTLCPQHLLVPKYGRICSVVIPQTNWTLPKHLTHHPLSAGQVSSP